MKTKLLIALGLAVVLAIAIVAVGSAVSGAAFTTFNAAADGAGKDVCKNRPLTATSMARRNMSGSMAVPPLMGWAQMGIISSPCLSLVVNPIRMMAA
jgi:hypothetical protein